MIKQLVKRALKLSGYEIHKLLPKVEVATDWSAIGSMDLLIEDLNKRGLNCKTILDVGANATYWSRVAKRVFPSAKFYLIEPQAEMKESLDKFCEEFENSKYFLAGAGAEKSTLTLTIWDDLVGSSFLPKADTHLKNSGKQREIEILTIDDLIDSSKMEMPEMVKLDIQGFELEALKGATKIFGHTEVFILEVSLFSFEPEMPIFSDIVNFMLDRGYVVYDFPGFLRRPLDGALGQCDVCFVKRNGFLRSSDRWI